jgi:hypothetical protein
MIQFDLAEKPELVDLAFVNVDSHYEIESPAALNPPGGRVTAGGPDGFQITEELVAGDKDLRRFIRESQGLVSYYYVRLGIVFALNDRPPLGSAQVELTLTTDPGTSAPIALSIRSVADDTPARAKRRAIIGPGLSLPSIEDEVSSLYMPSPHYKQTSSQVRNLGIGTPTPRWEFTSTPEKRLAGSYRLELIVQASRGAQLSVNGTMTAQTSGIWRRHFRAELPRPLTFKPLNSGDFIEGNLTQDARSDVREGAVQESADGSWSGIVGGDDHGGTGSYGVVAEQEPRPRFLTGILPERAPTDVPIPLFVQITLAAQGASTAMKGFSVAPSGTTVTITVSALGLDLIGDSRQDLLVPFAADSEQVRFWLIASQDGRQSVRVRAFADGTCLSDLTLEISVETGVAEEQGRARAALMADLTAEPGEVTLQVSRTVSGYSFQLLSQALYPVVLVDRLAGDPATVLGQMLAELRALSKGKTPYATPALARRRLQSLGSQLWADVVPETIREQFWAQRDRIKLFTIASDMDTVPWELLYPVDLNNDNGFLVEQFPVVRRIYGQGRERVLRLDRGAGFIVPPNPPANAMNEIAAVRAALPDYVLDRGTGNSLGEVLELLDAVPSVLHFAGHNAYTDELGSLISLDGGPLRPSDLSYVRQRRAFESVRPLVFFNGCRTAGEIPGFTQLIGWAREFMGAGAGAFIGSLWAVRSSSALTFAEEFYNALIRDGESLGVASLRARKAIAADEADPTWLAYTVYGNPSASVMHNPHPIPRNSQ